MSDTLAIIVSTFVTIGAYSILFGDNVISKITENLYMGILAAFIFTSQINYIRMSAITKVQQGEYAYIAVIILIIMLFCRLKPQYFWLTRYPVAITIGVGLGLSVRAGIVSDFFQQIQATMLPLNSLNNIVLVLGTLTVIAYFIWTYSFTGPAKHIRNTGMTFLLAMIGTVYGQTVAMRHELIVGRITALMKPEVRPYTYIIVAAVALIIYGESQLKKKNQNPTNV